MTECIRERFPSNAIDLVSHQRLQRARCAFDDYLILDLVGSRQVLRDLCQRALQILLFRVPQTKTAYRLATLIAQVSQELRNAPDQWFRCRISGDLAVSDLKL